VRYPFFGFLFGPYVQRNLPTYMLSRVIIHDSALYPKLPHFRETYVNTLLLRSTPTSQILTAPGRLIKEMRKLVEKFPDGYVEA